MNVGVVEREVAVLPLADDVGQSAERQDIDVLVEKDPFVEGQAFAFFHFVGDRSELRISGGGNHGEKVSVG